MDPNYHTATAIFKRFRRALLTDDYPAADALFVKASELVPVVQEQFDGDLMEYEIFLLAGVLATLREVQALKIRIRALLEKSDIHFKSDFSPNSSSSSPS